MAGHSKFKNIMYRKGAQDKKRANLFAKLAREILVAAKDGGGDVNSNARLRLAVNTAKANSMPKDNIERAIKKGMGGDSDTHYEYIRYEGYGPGGVAIIVDALTDNKNRTAPELRALFSKAGGSIAEPNSVAFMFDRVGHIVFDKGDADFEMMFENALEAGADDVIEEEDAYEIICALDALHQVQTDLSSSLGDPKECGFIWKPQNVVAHDQEKCDQILKLLDQLEDHDDVQAVFSNLDLENYPMGDE